MAQSSFSGPVVSTNGFTGDVTGNVTGNLTGDVTGNISGTATALIIPTSDPGVAGAIWLDGVTLSISAG